MNNIQKILNDMLSLGVRAHMLTNIK